MLWASLHSLTWRVRSYLNPFPAGSNDSRRRKPGQDAAHFKTDDSGKIVINEETFKKTSASQDPSDDLAGQAYREQMTSVDGFARTPTGEVKFHKNTKKRRAEEAAADALYADGDVEMGDGTASRNGADAKKKKKTERVHLGQEFKAKVRLDYLLLHQSNIWPI